MSDMIVSSRRSVRRLWTALLVLGALVIAGFAIAQALEKKRQNDLRWSRVADEVTGSVSQASTQYGPSGLPLPRFVSLKSAKVNVRRGPSSDHEVAWVFQRKGMPVEITAEFDNWRRIRDSDGQEGWILQQMLSGKRTVYVMASTTAPLTPMREEPDHASGVLANLQAGVSGDVEECNGEWCLVSAGGYDGYVAQARLWGVYPGEAVN
jgi:SH3-like domain-containing protein